MSSPKTIQQTSLDALEAINAKRRLPAGTMTDALRLAMSTEAHRALKSLTPRQRGTIVEAGLAALEDQAAKA